MGIRHRPETCLGGNGPGVCLAVRPENGRTRRADPRRADLEGMASYFLRIAARIGIYSTPRQWDPLVTVTQWKTKLAPSDFSCS